MLRHLGERFVVIANDDMFNSFVTILFILKESAIPKHCALHDKNEDDLGDSSHKILTL